MNRENILKALWPVLICILVLVWIRAFKGTGSRRSGEQSLDRAMIVRAGGTGAGPVIPSRPRKSSYADWGRTPFVFSPGVSQDIVLGGILWDANRPAAIISGEIVEKGNSIGSFLVVDIQKDHVILSDGEKDVELRLDKEE